MSVTLSPDLEARLIATAHSEGLTVNTLLECLINEREELVQIVEQAEAESIPLDKDELREKLNRGFLQSERGELVDGDAFMKQLISEAHDEKSRRNPG